MKLAIEEYAQRRAYTYYMVLDSVSLERVGEITYFPCDEITGYPKAKAWIYKEGYRSLVGTFAGEGCKEKALESIEDILSKPPILPKDKPPL